MLCLDNNQVGQHMSGKASALMKSAQIEKTKQTVDRLVEWYASKEQFFKKYLPIQMLLTKKLMSAPELTMTRLKDIAQIVLQEKEIQATIYEKNQKNILNDESHFAPKTEERIDPKDPKAVSKIRVQLPTWSNNIDRILVSMSRGQRQRQSKIKAVYKLLDGIHESLLKEEARYRSELKKEDKDLQRLFNQLDECEKEESKIMGRIIKQGKGENLKDSSFFIAELKKLEAYINGQFRSFVERNKVIAKAIQLIIRNEKTVCKKIKEQLTLYLTYKKQNTGRESRTQQQIWGFLSLAQDKIEEERLKYYNAVLLKPDKIADLKLLLKATEFKSNWQVVVSFLQMGQAEIMSYAKADEEIGGLLKNMSYRCWPGISLAQGWLIESYTAAVLYMTYDYIMLIYTLEGDLLKKINTSSSKVNKMQGQTLFLEEKIKGFFADSIEEYKIRFDEFERMEEFQLFIENQIR